MFPDEVDQYEPELIKEIINNCIAHQDYRLRGKINVEEFEDRLVFINEGAFIPETIEQALEPGYKPPYYRNVFLCNAMVNLYMIDTNSMGIPMMYQIQRDKCFPLPTYDLNTINRVTVTVYGKILDKNYTQLLYSNEDLDMRTVFLLDKVQKQEVVSKESFKDLKKKGLVEGRYPNVFVSFKVADIVGQKAAYVRNKGLDDDICKQLIIKALQSMGEASKRDLMEVLEKALPEEGIILPVKAFGYKSIKPEPRENFKTEIDTIVLGCQEKGKETYSQLNKIVDLHNAALNQQDLNDAFLNLWSALEVASVTDSSKSKIESVTDNIVSILQNDYFECIFSNILDDLKNNLGNRKVSLLLKDITEFDKEICKIAGFIFLEKYEKYREDYFANELKYYPNIRYKIYNLYEQRENREKLWHLSEKYCQRIEWHLYRLYRLRNAIVHAGESHKRIQMLGEHLHIYVDRVILELMVKLAKDKCLGTIQDVFTDTYLLLNKKKKNLKEPGNVDEQSIMLLLENFFIEE